MVVTVYKIMRYNESTASNISRETMLLLIPTFFLWYMLACLNMKQMSTIIIIYCTKLSLNQIRDIPTINQAAGSVDALSDGILFGSFWIDPDEDCPMLAHKLLAKSS